jgi:hypothetical protein
MGMPGAIGFARGRAPFTRSLLLNRRFIMIASRATALRRRLSAVVALSIPLAQPVLAQSGVLPNNAPTARGQHTPPQPSPRIKTPAQVPTKEPIDPDRLAALQRPGDRAAAPPKTPTQHDAIQHFRLDQVMFDEPGDGPLWASGNTYKARFNSSGFTYIPKLGPSAPRDFPISFVLQAITVGEQSLVLQSASPTRQGDSVHFDRGAITESYTLAVDSLEQTFTFNARPAGAGDLVIRMAVQTELPVTEDAGGFVFAHDLGSVTYSRAVVVDAAGRHTDVLTRLNSNAGGTESSAREIEIELPTSLLDSATWPIVVDPIIQTNVVEANFADRSPDVAYDRTTDTFCIVFEEHVSATDGDVWTYRLNGTTGALVPFSLSSIDITTTNWRRPKIANNDLNENYLVVAEAGLAPTRTVRGRTVSTTAGTISAQFSIGDSVNYPGDQSHPDVGGDPDDELPVFYCVVWQNEFSSIDHDILARMVTPAGTTSGAVIEVDYSTNDDFNPAISNGNPNFLEWAIAWDRRIFSSDHDIFASRLNWNGAINDPTFGVDTTTSDNRNPSVSSPMFDGSNAIVYEENPASDGDVWCRVMNGTSIVASQNLTELDGVIEQTRLPVVDANSSQFVVAYEEQYFGADWDAYASTYCYLTTNIDVAERHRRLAYESEPEGQLMLASKYSAGGGPDRALISWVRLYDSGVGDLMDAMYQIPASCCPEDTDHNGVIDVDDLVAVILSWGSCVNCNADIDGNTIVDVDDLVAVILAWGPCS